MTSLLNIAGETARQAALAAGGIDDSLFLQNNLYFFELRLPLSCTASGPGPTQSYLFPLVLGPDSYTVTEPFALEPSYTQAGGLFVEETGVITRVIRLRGTTGFAPKKVQFNSGQMLNAGAVPPSFSRRLPPAPPSVSLSGQRHFHYLQDAVFRTYGDYKRNAATAAATSLIFHVPHDDEHWLVAPRNFTMDRSASAPVSYQFDIELLAIDRADPATLNISEDANWLGTVRDVLHTVGKALNLIAGGINDLTAFTGTLRGLVSDVGSLINNVTSIFRAAGDFATGVTGVIQTTIGLVTLTQATLEQALATSAQYQTLGKTVGNIGPSLAQSLRNLDDAFDTLNSYPDAFQTTAAFAMQALRAKQQALEQQGLTSSQAAQAQQAILQPGVGPVAQITPSATPQALPGDALRLAAISTDGQTVNAYTGASQYTVRRGDTLANIAARFLGDARLWQYLALANGLRPPLLDTAADFNLSNAGDDAPVGSLLGVGRQILLPDYSTPPAAQPSLPILGVSSSESAEAHYLGTDLALAPVGTLGAPPAYGSSRDQLDLLLDPDSGGTDVQVVQGVANMTQAVLARLSCDLGTDVLYQSVGVQPVVATSDAAADLLSLRFRIQSALAQDPRVVSVASVQIVPGDGLDQANLDVRVVLRGQSGPTSIQVGLTQT